MQTVVVTADAAGTAYAQALTETGAGLGIGRTEENGVVVFTL